MDTIQDFLVLKWTRQKVSCHRTAYERGLVETLAFSNPPQAGASTGVVIEQVPSLWGYGPVLDDRSDFTQSRPLYIPIGVVQRNQLENSL